MAMPHQMHVDEIARAPRLLMITPPHAKSSWTSILEGVSSFKKRAETQERMFIALLHGTPHMSHFFRMLVYSFLEKDRFLLGKKKLPQSRNGTAA